VRMCSRAHSRVLISVGMDSSSSSDECLPLKSSPVLNFAVLYPVSSRFSPPPRPTPVCRPPVEVFAVSARSNLLQEPAHCCHLRGLCSMRFLLHGCSGPVFLVFARKGKRENHEKIAPLQNHTHKPFSWLTPLGYSAFKASCPRLLAPCFGSVVAAGRKSCASATKGRTVPRALSGCGRAMAVGGINGRVVLF